MKKPIFTWEEARIIGFEQSPSVLKFQLHYWRKTGELISLKRGVYLFTDQRPEDAQIASALYAPCYFSLEWGLQHYGLIPEAVFAHTLVTPKATRTFQTPLGRFIFHKIKPEAFLGYDATTLLAQPEKALVDYLYLYSHRLVPKNDFWEELRLQNLEGFSFKKARIFAKYFKSKKVLKLLDSLEAYAKSSAVD